MKKKLSSKFRSNARVSICVALFYSVAIPAHARTITVTNTNDAGPGSLRQALSDAIDHDRIEFAVTGTIGLTTSELLINKSITISGPGSDILAVSRTSNTGGIFHVMPSKIVRIQGLTISGGYAGDGGGILNDHATLTLTNCSVVANFASYGGGIYNDGDNGTAALTIVNCAINDNSVFSDCDAQGGGIANLGSAALTILNSTISGNSAAGQLPCNPGEGGGIAGGGTITNSTINGNHAGWLGGGIAGGGTITNSTISNNGAGGGKNYIPGAGGGIYGGGTITNCTITGNSVFGDEFKGPGLGGGIYAVGTLTISNSTLSDNTISYGNGGGIYNRATLGIGNTILNTGGGFGENIFNNGGTITSVGYNLSSDDAGGYLNGQGDQINTDPLLGPLQNNGGSTSTHALLPGSPAIDAGDPSFAPPPWYDQRGPDFWRLRNDRVDIGSFEVQEGPAVTPTPTPTPTPTATPRATPTPRSRPTTPPRPTPR